MSTKDRKEISEATPDTEQQASKPISRRALLRGAVTAMPVVLTLQSGAALARSSNLISASHYSSEDRRGRTLCLDTDSVNPVGGSDHTFDLGEEQICRTGRPGFYRGEYGWEEYRGGDQEDYDYDELGGDDDGDGQEFVLRWDQVRDARYRRRWRHVRVRRGVLVSATALSSFAGSVRVTDL